MENYEFKDIKEMSSKVSELPNSELIKIMEILSTEFDNTKNFNYFLVKITDSGKQIRFKIRFSILLVNILNF